MERAGEGDDRLAAGGGTGDFYSIFDSFRTGGDKDCLLGKLARNSLVQALGEAARAILMAFSTASAPVVTKIDFCSPLIGTIAFSRSASRT